MWSCVRTLIATTDEAFAALLSARVAQRTRLVEGVIARGVATGDFTPCQQPPHAAVTLLALLDGAASSPATTPPEHHDLHNTITTAAARLLGIPSPSPHHPTT